MNRKQFTRWSVVITAIVGAVVGYSVHIRNFIFPVAAVIAGILVLHILKRNVDEVIEDERTYRISERASRRTLQIFGAGTALIGITLTSLGKYPEIGQTLNISVCILIILYLVFYAFYSRRPID